MSLSETKGCTSAQWWSFKHFNVNQTFSSGGSTGFVTEPYGYREYFDNQGYIPSRATIYSDSDTPSTSYEGRFTTAHAKNVSIYAKPVASAAGLTVDLPSPDSGIGTEAITPRDQNNIQQVNYQLLCLACTNFNAVGLTSFSIHLSTNFDISTKINSSLAQKWLSLLTHWLD